MRFYLQNSVLLEEKVHFDNIFKSLAGILELTNHGMLDVVQLDI